MCSVAQYSFKLMVKVSVSLFALKDHGCKVRSQVLYWPNIYWLCEPPIYSMLSNEWILNHSVIKKITHLALLDCIFPTLLSLLIFLLLYNWNYFFFLSATFLINFPKNILTPSSKCTDITPGDNFRNSWSFIIRENYP